MQLLSESKATAVGRAAPSSEDDRVGPPEFRELSAAICPPEDRSLFEHFSWRFTDAIERHVARKRLWFLLWDAEHALKTRSVPPTDDEREQRVAMVLNRADEAALKKYIVETFEGEHGYRVHLQLKLPLGWIEKVREDAGCDPDYGQRRPVWKDLMDSEKFAYTAALADRCTQVEAARRLGVSLRTVKAYWPSREAAA